MSELESIIEKRLIDQLCNGESQWNYRPDIKNEEQLWVNFKYILEQNNKAVLDGTALSESEFAKIKNDVSHASFYDSGKWLTGENGKVYVHIQRGNQMLHLLVLNNEHIAGGTSTYEVINQVRMFAENNPADERDRAFDVSLLINGLPIIHIELKNKNHSYMQAYNQIKKYIDEGKFRGIFSNVQMFVVSNAVDTKYFAAARGSELNKKFITGWVNKENKPVCDYIEFAESVLKIPNAHEMIAKYVVLDNESRKLLILRPYQIHAIEAMREASQKGISGYIWHTTGSGKTMTSYKATRNLLMDIPSIEKTIFLIDRKDLDSQTKMAFQSYAYNDTIDVDDTENVDSLIKKLADGNRQMIVTTRQKLQIMINRRVKEGSRYYDKIKKLKVAFVVDECHRAVTPKTKRLIENFFSNSLWYGFTGTPIFTENKYEQKGDLPQTTEELYGKCLHSYTIKEAIHDESVLGFMIENLGPESDQKDNDIFETEEHMRSVLNIILNRSYEKFGMQNGRGRTNDAILTVNSIEKAQRYYSLLMRIKEGKDTLKINEDIRKALPDFPKFAITYSLSENEDDSKVNEDEMKNSLRDYNEMFGTNYRIENILAYNANLNDRLARKGKKYLDRSQPLDLVIVVDRLLTGFDAPCLSTLFMDRQPMSPQNIIQAFSRTNRLFDASKQYGQIVTFQDPDGYKNGIEYALKLYSRGGGGKAISENWDTVLKNFTVSVNAIHMLARTPEDIRALSRKQKRVFISLFRDLDNNFAHLKAFTCYYEDILSDYDFSEKEYEDYAAMYKNIVSELKPEPGDNSENEAADSDDGYDLIAYHNICVTFEYLVELLQGFIDSLAEEDPPEENNEFEDKILELRKAVNDFASANPKMGVLLNHIVDDINLHREHFIGQDISTIINQVRDAAIDEEVNSFAQKWFIDPSDVRYEVFNYKDGVIANENELKEKANYSAYKQNNPNALKKFQFRKAMIEEFKNILMESVSPLLN